MLWMLLWQFVAIIALAVLIVVVILISKLILNSIQRRRERRMYGELYGPHGVYNDDFLEKATNGTNSGMMADPLIIPEHTQAHMPHDYLMSLRPDTLIMNKGAVNNSQDNILRVNSLGAVLFPDSF